MDGFLNKGMMEELINLGLTPDYFYEEGEPRYYIIRKFKPFIELINENGSKTKKIFREILTEELIISKEICQQYDNMDSCCFVTISLSHLVQYLNTKLEGGYIINSLYRDEMTVDNSIKYIEFMDNNHIECFKTQMPCFCLEVFLFQFLRYLSKEKKYLL